ncbi:MAG: CehA/McbA family metallohydrolase [Verrucomicrobiota bacterium]|nr:CehA/McbA family metallohydrolase [Verrucomicrobiota bacterium]
MNWYKGNLHCHTTNSDGKSSPEKVAAYYKELGHDFLAISDHNSHTKLSEYGDALDKNFIGIPASEFTGEKCCHVLAIGTNKKIIPTGYESPEDTQKKDILQDGIDKIQATGAIPIICHPPWRNTFDEKIIMQTNGAHLFEVCNASPDCASYPTMGFSNGDSIWDALLSKGFRYFGIASDDAHCYYENFHVRAPRGGKGWIVVKAESLTVENIINSINCGKFYATTGVTLQDYEVTDSYIHISISPKNYERATFEFIGNNGKILQMNTGIEASYRIEGNENYIRIRISSSWGGWAWTQPVFLG